MGRLTPDRTPEGWSSSATEYERVTVRFTRPYAVDAIARLSLRPGDRVLDVACGPGTATFLAAERGATVLAVDYAPAMIERLREAVATRGVTGVEAAVMSGEALDVPDGSFDAAACVFGLMFFLDQPAGVRELRRALRAGGRAAIVTWGPPERNPGITISRDALVTAIPDFPPPDGPPAVFSLSDPAMLERLMTDAGFETVTVEPVERTETFEGPEVLWELLGATPVFDAVRAIAGDRLEAVRRELLRLGAERFGAGAITVPSQALIAMGTAPGA